MKNAVVFGGQNSLDFSEVRASVVRIPEVSLKIEQAQQQWDACCRQGFSFHHFLTSEDNVFFNSINLKSLSLAVVQLGLVDRYIRLFGHPRYVVGNVENDSAVKVVTGHHTLASLIAESTACGLARPLSPLKVAASSDIVLNGRSLPKYQAYRLIYEPSEENGTVVKSEELFDPEMNLAKILQKLVDEESVKKIINVGPGHLHKSDLFSSYESRDLQVLESIDIDPMLGWFWQGLRRYENFASVAQ